MESNNDQHVCPYTMMQKCPEYSEDGINLMNLCYVLWRRWALILVITVLFTALGSAYVFFTPKKHTATIGVGYTSNIAEGRMKPEFIPYVGKSEAIFRDFVTHLEDNDVKTQFWNQNTRVRDLNKGNKSQVSVLTFDWFAKNLGVSIDGTQQVMISLVGEDPVNTDAVLKEYISYVGEYSERIEVDKLKEKLSARIKFVKMQIEDHRQVLKRRTSYQIAMLHEHKAIAEKLNIIDTPDYLSEKPLYARGAVALQAEIDSLLQRDNNDAYDEMLPDLFVILDSISNVDFDNFTISDLSIISSSDPKPIKPKYKLIPVSFVLGIISSVFLVFMINFLNSILNSSKKTE